MSAPGGTAGRLSEELSVLEPLLGSWRGASSGRFGAAEVERVAEPVFQGHFLRVTTRSVSAKDVHEDIAFFSYDRERKVILLREFHSEGYVIRYELVNARAGVLTFESEHIENPFDPTLRARTVIDVSDPGNETLELATAGGPFEACVDLRLRRAPADV